MAPPHYSTSYLHPRPIDMVKIPGTGVLNFTKNPTQVKSTRDIPKPLAPLSQLPLHTIRSHQHTRPCSQCKTPVPTTQQFKLCAACRERGRINNANYLKRIREQQETMSRFSTMGKEEKRVGKKSKVDVKGKGKEVDMSAEKRPTFIPPSTDPPTEYQTPALLLSALSSHYFRSRSSSPPYTHSQSFTATYSILSTANPPITLEQRVEMVSAEVWKSLWCVGVGMFGVFE
ncbi:hypothetical protein PILCRDRAFT_14950 [Piloderma croceum F 1598]|uniref:Uncharacterized protein n=1 Tax=Piloderma croceum (strain F 1598) TaxID=765440 RepID=A0A0C3B912_PILCF|nr:hypothetical protein PILCRDRAFT_14950 [Piloderma croceum F 1598]